MSVKPLYFYYGEEQFLVEEAVESVKQLCPNHSVELYSSKFELMELMTAIMSQDMFASKKMFILKNPFFIFDALDKKQVMLFESLVEALLSSDHVMVVYQTEKKVDKRKKGFGLLKKHAELQEFLAFKDWESVKLHQWIQSRMKRYGKTIDPQAVQALEDVGGRDLRVIHSELEKLDIYLGQASKITVEDVKTVTGGVSTRLFEFQEALKKRSVKDIIRCYYLLIRHGEEPFRLLAYVVSQIRFYLQLLDLSASQDKNGIARSLGKNPFFIQKLLPEIKRSYSVDDCCEVLSTLQECDLAIKSGQKEPVKAVELALLNLVRI